MAKKFKEDEFCMNGHESKIVKPIEPLGGSGQGKKHEELESEEDLLIYTTFAPRTDDPYVMVRDAAMAALEYDDDDITAPKDLQPSEPHGSLHDLQ
nr:hypothetical protein [Tanacetum cinerariifolium]